MGRRLFDFLKTNWGFSWLVLISLVSVVTLLKSGPSLHYDFFSASAQKIWRGENPYGIHYPAGIFNYSPSCALFYYGLFAFFPYKLGLGLYVASSLVLLIVALWKIARDLELSPRSASLFYFVASSEVIGTALNARLELFILATSLFAAHWILRRRQLFWAYFVLAMVCNFKLQSLPAIGLLLLLELVHWRNFKAIAYFVGASVFWLALPFAVKAPHFVLQACSSWMHFLNSMVSESWLTFQHVFRFYWKITGHEPDWQTGQLLSAFVGLGFAAWVLWLALKKPALRSSHLVMWCLGLGGVFISAFSPASQSAAYVLYLPMLALAFSLAQEEIFRGLRKAWLTAIAFAWAFVSLSYSDLNPKPWRLWSFDVALKAPSVLLFGLMVMALYLASARKSRISPEAL